MRIIRNNDHNDDDPEDFDGPTDPQLMGEILANEASDFLAAAASSAPFHIGQDAPPPPAEPAPAKPALRLVKPDTATLEPAAPAARRRGVRPQLLRAGIGGSLLITALVVVAGWGEPLIVGGPLAVYGLGWITYLCWNAALRPPLTQAVIAVTGATAAGIAAACSAITHKFRAGIGHLETARDRHETTRTGPVPPAL
ncbi:hypothetical protein [Nocardia sp. XZ_19_385]|uniref:hypothetical protein n=1 Tax=Nocardia sp. XZ_19_385 TaxID=2769488 RepID=UPI00188F1233|nr:hypothetical protein [Nocardia sp. XZ_19_385]